VDSGSQSGYHQDLEVFFHIDAGGIANKGSASDNVQISKPTYNLDGANWSEEEDGAEGEGEEEVLARIIRSPQDFDDDVEMSSSEEKRYRSNENLKKKTKGKKKNNSNEQ